MQQSERRDLRIDVLRLDVEAALLARGAVRRGRHLRIRCPAPGHDDAHPSADVDLERGWTCRSCHAGGSLRQLAELIGLAPPRPPRRGQSYVPPRLLGIDRAAWGEAWRAIVEETSRQDRRLKPFLDLFLVADSLRARREAVTRARQLISALGSEHPAAWPLALTAACAETAAAAIEAELDELVRHLA
jgi:hypothetical protein